MLLLLQSIFDGIGWGEVAAAVVGLFVLLYALKVTLPTQLFTTTNDLLDKRTTERDDALREKDSLKKEVELLEEEIKTLRREIIQRIDISREDQQTIRELKQHYKVQGE